MLNKLYMKRRLYSISDIELGAGEACGCVEHESRGHVELRRAALGARHQGGSLRGQPPYGARNEGNISHLRSKFQT